MKHNELMESLLGEVGGDDGGTIKHFDLSNIAANANITAKCKMQAGVVTEIELNINTYNILTGGITLFEIKKAIIGLLKKIDIDQK